MIDKEKFDLFSEKMFLIMDKTIRETNESMGFSMQLTEYDKRQIKLMKDLVKFSMEAVVEEFESGRLSP